jgi:antitoxin ChpS
MGERPMSKAMQTTVVCQDPGDGSSDVFIDLHPDVFKVLNIGLGDLLSIELANGSLALKPIREVGAKSWGWFRPEAATVPISVHHQRATGNVASP